MICLRRERVAVWRLAADPGTVMQRCTAGSGSRARHWQLLSRPLGLLSASWFAEACRFDAVFSSTGQTLRVGHAVRAAPAVIGSVEEADGRFLLLKIFPP